MCRENEGVGCNGSRQAAAAGDTDSDVSVTLQLARPTLPG